MSLFMPAIMLRPEGPIEPGWRAMTIAFTISLLIIANSDKIWALPTIFFLTNIIMFLTPIAVVLNYRGNRIVLLVLVTVAGIFNAANIFRHHEFIFAGYYLWCASFLVVGAALYAQLRGSVGHNQRNDAA